MMNHLQEIEDAAARDGVNRFQAQMEIVVLSLLHPTRAMALIQIAEARTVSLDHVNNFGSAFLPIDHESKAGRIAIAMLEHTFDRLRVVIESPDDDGPPTRKAN